MITSGGDCLGAGVRRARLARGHSPPFSKVGINILRTGDNLLLLLCLVSY
jgi:hypothetical protein